MNSQPLACPGILAHEEAVWKLALRAEQWRSTMLLLWKICYLDSRDRQTKNRELWLDTNELDPTTRASLELCNELRSLGKSKNMVQYRHLFKESDLSPSEVNELVERHGGMDTVFLTDYTEDEEGKQLTEKEIAMILTGNSSAVMFPAGTPKHYIEYALSERRPVPVDQVTLTEDQLSLLGYFARDLRELLGSSFYKEGPGTLTTRGGQEPTLRTAATDEEIRSFVTVFRRLYMENEPANFLKAISLFSDIAQGNSLAPWIKGTRAAYDTLLNKPPSLIPFGEGRNIPFSRKRLIDVFLYTRYAHQPGSEIDRKYRECLEAVGNTKALLTWSFLGVLYECSLHMRNAGIVVANFYDRYCKHHEIDPNVIDSVAVDHPGIGALEKKQVRIDRLIDEKARELAQAIWIQEGRPEGGSERYFAEAREQLRVTL